MAEINEDLMNFECEEKRAADRSNLDKEDEYDDENTENQALTIPPSLVQSPVIVNSILKQSNKDNLIQLYTPIQKAEKGKLKVHFGHDSLLETPNIRQTKKRVNIAECIQESETETPSSPVKTEPNPPQTSSCEQSHSQAPAPVPEIADSTDNCEEVAMETSYCEVAVKADDTERNIHDVLSMAGDLLNMLRSESTSSEPSTADESSLAETRRAANDTRQQTTAEITQASVEKNLTDNVVHLSGKEPEHPETVLESGGSELTTGNNKNVQILEEEPMDFEEAMDVDDEITFNIRTPVRQNSKQTPVKQPSEQTTPLKAPEAADKDAESITVKTEENEPVQKDTGNIDGNKADVVVKQEPAVEDNKSLENIEQDEGKVTKGKGVENKEESPDKNQSPPTTDQAKPAVSTKSGEASSDEEFMSADENMEVDASPAKVTPAKPAVPPELKQELSPERTPPKVGYNLNFDDLDVESMNPFATKKSLVNSPDVGKPAGVKEVKQESVVTAKVAGKTETKITTEENKTTDDVEIEEKTEKGKPDVQKETAQIEGNTEKTESTKTVTDTVNSEVHEKQKDEDKVQESKDIKDEEKTDLKGTGSEILKADETVGDDQAPVQENTPAISDSPAIPMKSGAYNLDFLDDIDQPFGIDPFKPAAQIVNSPDVGKTTTQVPPMESNPFKCKAQLMNSPVSSKQPVTPETKKRDMGKSDKNDNISDNTNANVNDKNTEVDVKAVANEKEVDTKATTQKEKNVVDPLDVKVADVNDTGSATAPCDSAVDMDPSKPVAQKVNSTDVEKITHQVPPCESDSTQSEQIPEAPSSPVIQPASYAQIDFDNLDDVDPFKPKKQMMNSPIGKTVSASTEIQSQEIVDPFKPTKQMQNSPIAKPTLEVVEKTKESENAEVNNDQDEHPKVKSQENTVDIETVEDIDPFKPTIQMPNSPAVKQTQEALPFDFDNLDEIDPFKPKTQMLNSPLPQTRAIPSTAKKDNPDSNSSISNGSKQEQLEQISDPFADLNPFEVKSKIANSPEKCVTNIEETVDPFKTSNKIVASPDKTLTEENPFETKSKVACTPEKKNAEENPFQTKTKVATTPPSNAFSPARSQIHDDDPFKTPSKPTNSNQNAVSLLETETDFEVQGVTRRGQTSAEGMYPDIDESQFVSASEIFNDPAAWEMLEKFGSAASKDTESALSRMSLYVKFDPLVDAAPTNNFLNPRRISIRASQLEKVKEYGLDETLLLLGTPPKKRRQSMAASGPRIPPGVNKPSSSGTPIQAQGPVKKLETVTTEPNSVDLIMQYSPAKRKEGGEMAPSTIKVGSLFDEEPEEEENLFQELKYTDSDVRRIRQEMRLALQGELMAKDREWCTRQEDWNREKENILTRWKEDKAEFKNLEQIFCMLEKTAYEISAAKKKAEDKNKELQVEKEQAVEDLAAIERSFSDLHRRYEKTKDMFMNLRKNEETLKKYAADLIEKSKKQDEKFDKLKDVSEEKLKKASDEIERLKQAAKMSNEKLKTEKKIEEMKVSNLEMKIKTLETALEKKTEDIKQLTEICDGLLAQVGK
ncbi:transforming acidic coiled-coil-containing protein 3-like [Mya arenaria]|uniref:transforming acidic coiled-coil-containing protein 3-like n=1 Tax=Mya arenaria TaxID=6604 RepID=UPI0022DF420C|nr:transforming acidic coiled-coil-containing protein 3-like [Mya arenaria]XP_052773297.1 transforming acidic coiled-coil-containing protein 3-like [Mya arenaria]